MPFIQKIKEGNAFCYSCDNSIMADEGFLLITQDDKVILYCSTCKEKEDVKLTAIKSKLKQTGT